MDISLADGEFAQETDNPRTKKKSVQNRKRLEEKLKK